MALVPREDCAKAVLHGASPREAIRSQDEEWRGRVLGRILVCCLCSLAQAEADTEHARSLLRVRLGPWALIDRERIEKRE